MCPQTREFFAAMMHKAGVAVSAQMAKAASRTDYNTATLLHFSLLTINRRTAVRTGTQLQYKHSINNAGPHNR